MIRGSCLQGSVSAVATSPRATCAAAITKTIRRCMLWLFLLRERIHRWTRRFHRDGQTAAGVPSSARPTTIATPRGHVDELYPLVCSVEDSIERSQNGFEIKIFSEKPIDPI